MLTTWTAAYVRINNVPVTLLISEPSEGIEGAL